MLTMKEPTTSMGRSGVRTTCFTDAMAAAATPVSIVSTDGAAGRFGVTVSAISSVSAEPPMILACVNRTSPSVEAIEGNGTFCVNMLSEAQSELANCFAGRPSKGPSYKFSQSHWVVATTGAPVLTSAVASFDCELSESYDVGTHRIFIGHVVGVRCSGAEPLTYAKRAYRGLRPLHH